MVIDSNGKVTKHYTEPTPDPKPSPTEPKEDEGTEWWIYLLVIIDILAVVALNAIFCIPLCKKASEHEKDVSLLVTSNEYSVLRRD